MKAVREVRPPGIYPQGTQPRLTPLDITDTHITGFVGLAQKGPLGIPLRIGSFAEFIEVYGASSDGYLARSVEGFFQNGGLACHIVRVARAPRRGEPLLPEHAACAERVLKDGWDRDTLRITALNEGTWGNDIWVRCNQTTGPRTLLTFDLPVGAGAARVNSTKGIEPGALLHIHDRDNHDYVIVTKVDDRGDDRTDRKDRPNLTWSTDTPILRKYTAAGPTYIEVMEFELYASLRDRREVFRNLQLSPLSRHYAPRVVNGESQLIRLFDQGSTSQLPNNLPVPIPQDRQRLSGGRDGIDGITVEDFVGEDLGLDGRTGLRALGHVEEVGLLCCPDAMLAYGDLAPAEERRSSASARFFVQRIQDVMTDICENTRDRFALLDLPPTRDIEEARRLRQQRDSSYAAYYFPWLKVQDEAGVVHRVPPSGHVAGIFAQSECKHGVHKAPANEPIAGVTQLTLHLSEDHIGQLNAEGVNTLRAFTGRGVRIWGARTTSSDPDWRYINVRRLFIMLRRAIERGTEWVAFEPNTPQTWSLVEREVSFFLRDLYTKGYFAGGSEADSFLVKCDAEVNPPDSVAVGRLCTEIRVAPALPTEYILFTIEQQTGEEAQSPPAESEIKEE